MTTTPIDLRLGRWQDVLADVTMCDAVICDPPYSARTHAGSMGMDGGKPWTGIAEYAPWTPDDVDVFMRHWSSRCRGWIVIATDDVIGPIARAIAEDIGRMSFPLVPVLQHMPRLSGDGPGPHGHYLAVSRPRGSEWSSCGSLPGWYHVPRERGEIVGAKPISLMRAIIRDYSRPGDLVVDPFCGSGTTAIAAAMEGRRCVTSEEKKEHYDIAKRRIQKGYQPCMLT